LDRIKQDRLEKRQKAIQSLRKIQRNGCCQTAPINFEWPTPENLAQMPVDQPIKIKSLNIKKGNEWLESL